MSDKIFTIKLTEDELNNLHDDYTMVEGVVDEIVDQAKKQGYKPPVEYNDV